jgi:hypothetical protein
MSKKIWKLHGKFTLNYDKMGKKGCKNVSKTIASLYFNLFSVLDTWGDNNDFFKNILLKMKWLRWRKVKCDENKISEIKRW